MGLVGRSDLAAAALSAAARCGVDSDSEVTAVQPATASFGSYRALLEEGPIDAVYLGLRGTDLLRHAIAALENGVHVLCEEAPASTAAEHASLVRAARARRSAAIVTSRGALSPVHAAAVDLARSNLLGKMCEFSAVACSKESEAGSLATVCLGHARRFICGEPAEVIGTARCGSTGFVSVALRFPRECLALLTCGSRRHSLRYDVIGSHGSLRVACEGGERGNDELVTTLAGITTQRRFPREGAFAFELARFSACVLRRSNFTATLREALANERVFEAIEQAHQHVSSVRLDAPTQRLRESLLRRRWSRAARNPGGASAFS